MTTIPFWMLWWLWFVGVAYDCVVYGLGIFQSRTFAQRIGDDVTIAGFIVLCWCVILVNRFWEKQLASRSGETA